MKNSSKRIIYTTIATMIIVFTTTYSVLATLEKTDYKNYLKAQYSKNMYELIDDVQNISTDLSKAAIIGSQEQRNIVFQDIFRNASNAVDKLHSIPVSQQALNGTSIFLSKTGDFCYSLAKKNNSELTDGDYKNIDKLKVESKQLLAQLNSVLSNLNNGKIGWEETRKKVTSILVNKDSDTLKGKFDEIQKQIVKYPTLIYDGPFSENVLKIKPKIYSEKIITDKQAQKIVENIIGKNRINGVEEKVSKKNGIIDSYSFDVTIKGRKEKGSKIACDISKNGGKLVYLIDNRTIGNKILDEKAAENKGAEYLKKIGYDNMYPTYKIMYGNALVINYVYKNGNVTIYPDQIKLKIALDDGSVVGVEAQKYLVAHTNNRQIPNANISQEEAKKKIGKKLNVKSIKKALIPTETNKEVLCYEFLGDYNGEEFIVYINALNGSEQKILKIINTGKGELTI